MTINWQLNNKDETRLHFRNQIKLTQEKKLIGRIEIMEMKERR